MKEKEKKIIFVYLSSNSMATLHLLRRWNFIYILSKVLSIYLSSPIGRNTSAIGKENFQNKTILLEQKSSSKKIWASSSKPLKIPSA